MNGTPVPIGSLPERSEVLCPWDEQLEVEVVEHTLSGTAVKIRRPMEKRFRTRQGKDVRIRKTTERTTWSKGTMVVPKAGMG